MNENQMPSGFPAAAARGASVNRRTLLRWGFGAAAAVTAAPLLAACGSDDEAAADGEVTLKVVGFQVPPEEKGSELDKAYQKFLADFQAQNPKIKIQPIQAPPNFDTQIIVDLASGSAPDLWSQDASSLAPLIQRKLLLDMRKVTAKLPSLSTDRFFPQVLEIHKGEDGGIYGLPNDFTPMVVYYNPTLFTKAGVPVPQAGWSWDDQLAAAQKLTLDNKGRNRLDPAFDEGNVVQWGYRLSQYAYQWVYRIWQNGGDVISPDKKTANGFLDAPAAIDAIQWYADLVLKHKVAPSPSTLEKLTNASDASALFVQGKFAMFDSGHWSLVGLTGAKGYSPDKVAVVPQPKRATEATALYESSFVLRHDLPAAKYKAAAQFIEAATSRGYQDTKAITGIALAANSESAKASLGSDQAKFAELDKVFVDATASGRPPYGSKIGAYPTIEKALDGMMEQILRGAPVRDQVAKTITAINRELAKR
ncbi:sugar ABC transporter substrate-binding protein [Micromonospora sp. WMMC241]|uniref:ABC transporter substrate-binding protein n=1 Tax=Micromonospora sp. WMMC241 TaxID=3015159 RepID=UPI0022B67500|nr:sugar ABC transporter substrate-binding protein [Micromonospora sp. WMMC241]MCZ7436731.1 sugar ABC transporter substrate-binding protein [Micromonospora sp. WMMC241]